MWWIVGRALFYSLGKKSFLNIRFRTIRPMFFVRFCLVEVALCVYATHNQSKQREKKVFRSSLRIHNENSTQLIWTAWLILRMFARCSVHHHLKLQENHYRISTILLLFLLCASLMERKCCSLTNGLQNSLYSLPSALYRFLTSFFFFLLLSIRWQNT